MKYGSGRSGSRGAANPKCECDRFSIVRRSLHTFVAFSPYLQVLLSLSIRSNPLFPTQCSTCLCLSPSPDPSLSLSHQRLNSSSPPPAGRTDKQATHPSLGRHKMTPGCSVLTSIPLFHQIPQKFTCRQTLVPKGK